MAKEVVTRCDKCGLAGDDVRTYTVRVDGHSWEVDLDQEHAKPIMDLAALGRAVDVGSRRGSDSTRSLERRIRGLDVVE